MRRKVKGGMYATFQGVYQRVEEELDLMIEARNIEAGQIYNHGSRNSQYVHQKLKVVQLESDIETDPDVIVLEKSRRYYSKALFEQHQTGNVFPCREKRRPAGSAHHHGE